jgi:hypothetical protein
VRILYLVGDSRSGSTLLQHLLSLQPGVHALGELRRLGAMARAGEPCACGEPLDTCSHWTQICGDRPQVERVTERERDGIPWRLSMLREATAIRGGLTPAGTFLRKKSSAAAAECMEIYEAVAAHTGASVLIDNSKEPDHFLHLYASYPDLVHPVFLHRDGRGLIWSKIRRAGVPHENAINGYLWMQRMIETARRAVGAVHATELRYEDLCRDPRAELECILKPHDIPIATVDLAVLPTTRHDIGGSPSFQGSERRDIRLDESWRTDLPPEALAAFQRRGATLNRFRGYTD